LIRFKTNNINPGASFPDTFPRFERTGAGLIEIVRGDWIPPKTDHVTLVNFPSTAETGSALSTFTVEARRTDETIDTEYSGNVVISKLTGSGNIGGTTTRPLVSGVATFDDITFDAVDTYSIQASCNSLAVDADTISITWAMELFNWQPIAGVANYSETHMTATSWGQMYSQDISGHDWKYYALGFRADKDGVGRQFGTQNGTAFHADFIHLSRYIYEQSNSIRFKALSTQYYSDGGAYTAQDEVLLKLNTNWELWIAGNLAYTHTDGNTFNYVRDLVQSFGKVIRFRKYLA
jgi:hypothetical protein